MAAWGRLDQLARPANPWQAWVTRPGTRKAAVLVPLFQAETGSARLLLTVRSQSVRHHRGQISFPGGHIEAQDRDATSAALREASEEVGIHAASVRVLGELDLVPTVTSNYVIAPIVGEVPAGLTLRLEPAEVDRALEVDLSEFRDPASRHIKRLEWAGELVDVPFFEVAGEIIWGATARIICALLEVIDLCSSVSTDGEERDPGGPRL
jgi:8-oxo-dGTP pyrophosphatase MutT (NUDIX family)